MANRRTHAVMGSLAGGGVAAFLAREQGFSRLLVEAAGGACAGMLAAALPDVIDPPTSFRHRGIGHGVASAAAAAVALAGRLPPIQQRLRLEAEGHAIARMQASSPRARTGHLIAELLGRCLAGAAVGAPAGYASHLALDARTPMGLPILS